APAIPRACAACAIESPTPAGRSARHESSTLSCRHPQNSTDHGDELLKLAARLIEAAAAFLSEAVNPPPRPAGGRGVVLPGSLDLPALCEPVEGRVKRAFLELQRSRPRLLEPLKDFKSMCIALTQDGEDQRLQMAAQRVAVDVRHDLVFS